MSRIARYRASTRIANMQKVMSELKVLEVLDLSLSVIEARNVRVLILLQPRK